MTESQLAAMSEKELAKKGLEFVPKTYEKTFFDAHRELVGYELEVHHAIPQAVLERYPGAFSAKEVNSIYYLRGIPYEATENGKRVHGLISKEWNSFLRKHPKSASREEILKLLESIDDRYGHHFTPPVR